MFPTIRKGDRIELEEAHQVQVDDIVVYRRADAFICHRVKTLGPDGLIITGSDSVDQGADAIARRDIIGRVSSIRRGRYRFAPAEAIPPTSFASFYRYLDQGRQFFSHLIRSTAMALIDRLTGRPAIGRLLTGVFMSCLRFHITERMPVESISLYGKTSHRTIWSWGPQRTRALIHQLEPGNRFVIQAYLGPYAAGSLDLHSGRQRLHPSLGRLGLELFFGDLLTQPFPRRQEISTASSQRDHNLAR
jgi:hypothetical protein